MNKKELKILLFERMISIYQESNTSSFSQEDAKKLVEISRRKIRACKSQALVCAKCNRKCFSDKERQQIKEVMKYSGKRIFFKNPILTLKYLGSLIK